MTAINSRFISDLDPGAAMVCSRHQLDCRAEGIDLLITSTYRNDESQEALWAIGRTVHLEQKSVTNARAGHSWHNFKCAWDVVPLVHGKCVWGSRTKAGLLTPLWARVVDLGKRAGALAGADWHGKLVDDAHFYVVPTIHGLHITMDEARARFSREGTIFTDVG